MRRLFSRPGRKAGLAYYVRLTHKLATRLGHARSRARSAEREYERLKGLYDVNIRQLQAEAMHLRIANGDLNQRVAEYEAAEAAALRARPRYSGRELSL